MANPNIAATTSILGNTNYFFLSTSNQTLITNAASSNQVYRINSIVIANTSASSAFTVTVNIHNAASGGGTAFPLVSGVSVPAQATLVVVDKTSAIYLQENSSITAAASTGSNTLSIVGSWEVIS